MPASPNVANYHIGKGVVKWTPEGGSQIDLGNAPLFQYAPTVTKLEHFSARVGVKTKDFSAITQISATITVHLDEITAENLSLFALAEFDGTTTGDATMGGLTKTNFPGTIEVTGTNDIGQQVDFIAKCTLIPQGNFSFITSEDTFSVLEIQAEVQNDGGNFGVWTVRDTTGTA
jgi:hypothetical protein